MKRKVIQLAGKTHVVSLPNKWVKQYGVKKGDEIDVEERGSKLIIATEKETHKDKILIDVDKIGLFDKRYLSFLYHKGYDEIELRYSSQEIAAVVQQRVGELMGYEIVDQGKNFCRIRNVSSLLESEFDVMLRRGFLVTLELADGTIDLLKKKQYEKLRELSHLEAANNKFTDFCKRLLNKKGYKEMDKTSLVYSILRALEEVGDQYKHICVRCSEGKVQPSAETMALFSEVNSYFRLLYELFYKFDREKASRLIFKKNDLLNKLEDAFRKTKNHDEKMVVHYLMSLTDRIFDMYGPCFVMNL